MSAHYHEDDYGMREILPIEFWTYCAVQMDTPEAEAAQQLSASSPLWEEVCRLMEKPRCLSSLAIPRGKLTSVLGRYLPEYERVESGTYARSEPTERNGGFGFNSYVGVFFDYDDKDVVQHVWLVKGATTQQERKAFIDALSALRQFSEFLFVDWLKRDLMRLDDRAELMCYFAAALGE